MKKVAIAGFGFMGRMHYGEWSKLKDAEVVAVCDANVAQFTAKTVGNKKGAFSAKLPKRVRAYTDFNEMLAAGGFDIVDITLPTPCHATLTIQALKAGYHVMCEKPMALSVKDCDAMLAAAGRAKGTLFVAQCARFSPQYAWLKEAVEDGRYGKVVAGDFTRFCPAPGWGPGGKSWFLDEAKSGGAAVDMHVHDADMVQYLFGKPPAVSTRTHIRADGLTDHLTTTYLYPDKVVTSDTSWAAAKSLVFDSAYRVFFEKATVYCGERYKGAMVVYPDSGKPFTPKLGKGTSYGNEIRYFLDLILGRRVKKEIVTAKDARNSIALVLAEKKSAATGKPVRVTFR